MSRQELADAVNAHLAIHHPSEPIVDANYVGKLERGKHRWPSAARREALRRVLDTTTDQELGLHIVRETHDGTTSPPDRLVSGLPDWADGPLGAPRWDAASTEALAELLTTEGHTLDSRSAQSLAMLWRTTDPPQLVQRLHGRRVGSRLASLVVERAATLRRMDDFLGGGDLYDLVRRELLATVELVRQASYTESSGRRLLAAVGELCQLAGWVASDAGLSQPAQRYYLGGVSAAYAAGDEPLAANLLSSLSYQMATIGDRREAALLAASAAEGARGTATATTQALLTERVAWAHARLGDPEGTDRALGEVEELFTMSEPEVDPPWVYWLDRDEIDVMAGRCWTELGRPDRAITPLGQAVARYDPTHARELGLYLTWLAEAHARRKDLDEAVAIARRALDLSVTVASVRGVTRVRTLCRLLAAHRGVPEVDDFQEHARTLLAGRGVHHDVGVGRDAHRAV